MEARSGIKKTPKKFKELTIEETLAAMRAVEEGIQRVEQKSYRIIKSDVMLPKAITYMIRLELAKENDTEFNKTGVDGSDIFPNMTRHNLQETEEYKTLMEEMKKKSDAFFDQFTDDSIAQDLRNARDRRINMRDTGRV